MLDPDPFPVDLRWVSRRRTREIVELHEAQRPRWRPAKADVRSPSVPFAPTAGVEFEAVSSRTVADYAVRATDYVKRQTGTLQLPDRFIRMTLDYVHLATFEVPFAWPDGSQQRVSTLFSSQIVDGVGRVFIALFGSPHNILANMEPERYHTGRTPSDANGLYGIINAMREPEDMQLRPEVLTGDRYGNDADDATRANLAAEVIYGLHDPLPAQRLEILAEGGPPIYNYTLSTARHGDGRPRPFHLIFIGSALWAGTPAPREDPSTSIPSAQWLPIWSLLNEHLYEFLEAWRYGKNPAIPDAALQGDEWHWRAYASWFVNLGRQFGQRERYLIADRRLPKWNPRRYLSNDWKYRSTASSSTGQSGFVLPDEGSGRAVLVTADGEVIPVILSGDGEAKYWPEDTGVRWLEPTERPGGVDAEAAPSTRRVMWMQAAEWMRRAH